MMNLKLIPSVALLAIITFAGLNVAAPRKLLVRDKVFNYLGALPIKDDRTGQLVQNDLNDTEIQAKPESDQAEAEAACWRLINEKSVVTFTLQNRVLDELKSDMNNLTMEDDLRNAVDKITDRMRNNMKEAVEALKKDAPDEFFDALFDSSEDIIHLSAILRDPKMDDSVFLALVKAVSRLGRNNTLLIQEFTDMCSFVQRSPRPRSIDSDLGSR